MSWCETCGRLHLWGGGKHHVCPPGWLVWCEDFSEDEEDGFTVRADSAKEAAELYCDRSDRGGDYDIIGRGYADTVVVLSADGERSRFSITAEAVPEYHATKIEGGD